MTVDINRVTVYHGDPYIAQKAANGASIAGWEPEVFTSVEEARDHLDTGVHALITGLGYRRPFGDSFPAYPLLQRAAFLDLPVAIVSGFPGAGENIINATQDIVVPTAEHIEEIVPTIQKWLGELTSKLRVA